MIYLPGILSQDGKKYTWERYSVNYTEKAGTAATVSRTYNKSKYASTAYTIQNGVFVLTNPVATAFENLTSGKRTVDIADSTNTVSSGATLYKITSNSGGGYTDSSSSYKTHSTTIYGSSIYGATTYTLDASTGVYTISPVKITASTTKQQWQEYGKSRYYDVVYSTNSSLKGSTVEVPTTSSTLYEFSVDEILVVDTTDGTITVNGTVYRHTAARAKVNIGYTPYTATQTRGDLIDTVTDRDPAAYPENGIQDGYWYVRQA